MDANHRQRSPGMQRKQYYIDKGFQNQFLVSFSTVIVLSTILFFAAMLFLHVQAYHLLPNGVSSLAPVKEDTQIYVSKAPDGNLRLTNKENGTPYIPLGTPQYNAFDLYFLPVLIMTALNILLILIFSLFFSHKLAGPMYRIKKSLIDFIAGKRYEPIELRRGDHMHDLAALINQAFEEKNYKPPIKKKGKNSGAGKS